MKECSCSIVFYNTPQKIAEKTIRELCKCREITKIFIIDNGHLIDYINIEKYCSQSSKELSIEKSKNEGLSVAQNKIINQKKLSDYHLILNPDIYIDSNCIKTLINYFENTKGVAALGPKIRLPSGEIYPSAKLIPDPLTQIMRRLNPSGKRNKTYELSGNKFLKPSSVPMISGCFILTKSEFLKNINGFDERFFLYFEDIDLLMRLKQFGEIHYHPSVDVIHLHGDASRKSFKVMIHHFISFLKYYFKWGWQLEAKYSKENSTYTEKIRVDNL